MYLTKRQRQVLDFIKGFIEEKGYSPSLQEIGIGFGLTSPATVHKHVLNLIDTSDERYLLYNMYPHTISTKRRGLWRVWSLCFL